MPISSEARVQARMRKSELRDLGLGLHEFQVRLKLYEPTLLSSEVMTAIRAAYKLNMDEFGQQIGAHGQSVWNWENEQTTPSFPTIVMLLIAELNLLCETEPLSRKEYDPRQGLLGRCLESCAFTRDQVRNILDRLGEIWLTPEVKG